MLASLLMDFVQSSIPPCLKTWATRAEDMGHPPVSIKKNGTGKAKWKKLDPGDHEVCADQCPQAAVLEALALCPDSPSLANVRRHVHSCERCRRVVEGIRDDAELLCELRNAAKVRLDRITRERLTRICRRVSGSRQ